MHAKMARGLQYDRLCWEATEFDTNIIRKNIRDGKYSNIFKHPNIRHTMFWIHNTPQFHATCKRPEQFLNHVTALISEQFVDWTIRLLLNWAEAFYRKQRQRHCNILIYCRVLTYCTVLYGVAGSLALVLELIIQGFTW